jgi:large subunit ribosomal protein L10
MPNPQKINTVAEIKKLFDDAGSIFITDYQGLSVAEITSLRKNLRENQITYRVAKNTLLKLAAHQAGVGDEIDEHLTGPTAVAFAGEDAAMAAKILHDSYKDRELPRMKMFVVDGQVFDGREIKRLADLPPREILLAQVVAAVESPFSELVGTLDGFFRKLVGSIEALTEKKKSEG